MRLRRTITSRLSLLTALVVLGTATLCPVICSAADRADPETSCHGHGEPGDEAPASRDTGRVSDCCCGVIVAIETARTDGAVAVPVRFLVAALAPRALLAAVDAPLFHRRTTGHLCDHGPPVPLYLADRSLLI